MSDGILDGIHSLEVKVGLTYLHDLSTSYLLYSVVNHADPNFSTEPYHCSISALQKGSGELPISFSF